MYGKRLTENEINLVLKKIKSKFEKYAKQFGKALFSYEAFRERYLSYLRSRGELEVFLFAEIQALEDKKNEILEKIEKKKRVKEAQNFLAQKEEELLLRIDSYPEEEVHDKARLEIKKLVGIYKVIYEQLNHYSYDIPTNFRSSYQECLSFIKDFVLKPYSGAFARYINDLENPFLNKNTMEKKEQDLIREFGVITNTFIFSLSRAGSTAELKEFINILKKIAFDFRLEIFRAKI